MARKWSNLDLPGTLHFEILKGIEVDGCIHIGSGPKRTSRNRGAWNLRGRAQSVVGFGSSLCRLPPS